MANLEIFTWVTIGVVVGTELANAFLLRRLPRWVSPRLERVVERARSSHKVT